MSLTERIANNIGIKSREILSVDDNREKIIVYGAINLLQVMWAIAWTCIMGLIFGVFFEAILFLFIISALRKYSGGVHASSPSRCIIIGTTSTVGFALFIKKVLIKISSSIIPVIGIVCILISLIIVIKKAPVDSAKKPIINPVIKQRFKLYSIMLICLYMIFMMVLLQLYIVHGNQMYIIAFQCIGLGSLWQGITLTRSGAKSLNKVDAVLKHILGGDN